MDYSVILLLANLKYNDYINFAIDLLNYVSCVQHTRMHEIFPRVLKGLFRVNRYCTSYSFEIILCLQVT